MAFPVKFVHVGLGKCGSTYLQQVWTVDQRYVMGNPAGLVQTLRGLAAKPNAAAVNIAPPKLQADKTAIMSSEGLSWGWTTGKGDPELVRNLRKLAAESIVASKLTGQVLVVVRDPVEWLRSLHEQSIKEGGCESYETYIAHKKEIALEILDLGSLVERYRQAGQKVVVLSSDELRHSPEAFWEKYASSLDVPKPSDAAIAAVDKAEFSGNVSLKERVPYLAKLNRHSSLLGACFAGLANYPELFKAECDMLKPAASQHWIWINRRVAEFATVSDLKAIAGEVEDAAGFQDVFVDPEMGSRIEKTFLACLAGEETIDSALVDTYRRSLDERLRGH